MNNNPSPFPVLILSFLFGFSCCFTGSLLFATSNSFSISLPLIIIGSILLLIAGFGFILIHLHQQDLETDPETVKKNLSYYYNQYTNLILLVADDVPGFYAYQENKHAKFGISDPRRVPEPYYTIATDLQTKLERWKAAAFILNLPTDYSSYLYQETKLKLEQLPEK